jgi:pimeloyl-ACP methyl ester carboxylesterase
MRGLVTRLAALFLGSLSCGALSSAAVAQEVSLVSVGGRRVEVVRMGQGAPTLVLESGGGAGVSVWMGLLPELAKLSQVIVYSRAGLGKSDPGGLPRSPQAIVAELHQLLLALGERGPIVLVGHSLGGLVARLYVSTFPTEVAGLVLVDGTHEAQFARWDTLHPGSKISDSIRAELSTFPPALRPDYELMLQIQDKGRVDGLQPLPDLPLAVITALKPCPPEREWTCREPKALAYWRQMHDEWFARTSTGLRIVSTRTGHAVMDDQPALVVEAARFVLDQVRSQKRQH